MLIKAYGATDIGKYRTENQDRFFIDEELGLYALADGMGGLADGTAAASLTLEKLHAFLKGMDAAQMGSRTLDIYKCINKTIQSVNEAVCRELTDAGSTLVFIWVVNGAAYFVNIGDSAGFLFRDGMLNRITKEHNVAGVLVDIGKITREDARTHPARNQLTSFIGIKSPLEASIQKMDIQKGDKLVICSDGLTAFVPEEDIRDMLASEADIYASTSKLIDMANEAGGLDNITIVQAEVIGY